MPFFRSVSGKKKTKLIVGLGNPGLSYKKTRHNAGAQAVEKLAKEHNFCFRPNRSFKSLIASGRLGVFPVCLALPQTFMNLSGEAVAALVRKKGVSFQDLLVVCDDVALPPGDLKVKLKGGDGGHKGLASIIERLGTRDFPRLRLGVGRDPGGRELADYVLSVFKTDEEPLLHKALDKALEAMECWVAEGIHCCMNRYNTKRTP